MSRKKNTDENVKPSTKEEIEAAVNACYGNPKERITVDVSGIPSGEDEKVLTEVLPSIESKENPPPVEPDGCSCKHGGCTCHGDCECDEATEHDGNPSLQKFLSDCANLNITASDCHYWSEKSSDSSIKEYLKGINRKIYKETQNGGYSTNITIRVVQKDWVNVSHIMDWYKSREFEVLNYRINNSPINMDTGVIEHNFTISWA